MGSPIARFLGRNVRGAIPNSLNRNINWKLMMENGAIQHQKRVERKGKKPKEIYKVGEQVLVQDIAHALDTILKHPGHTLDTPLTHN